MASVLHPCSSRTLIGRSLLLRHGACVAQCRPVVGQRDSMRPNNKRTSFNSSLFVATTSIEKLWMTFLTSAVCTETCVLDVTPDVAPTFALRMILTSSPIQVTNANFSRNECSSFAYFTRMKPNDARDGCSWDVNSSRSPLPVAVRTILSDLSDYH